MNYDNFSNNIHCEINAHESIKSQQILKKYRKQSFLTLQQPEFCFQIQTDHNKSYVVVRRQGINIKSLKYENDEHKLHTFVINMKIFVSWAFLQLIQLLN